MELYILGGYGILGVISFGIIIYLIIKRVRDKEKEDFEKRDN